jgi:hypothetical protein
VKPLPGAFTLAAGDGKRNPWFRVLEERCELPDAGSCATDAEAISGVLYVVGLLVIVFITVIVVVSVVLEAIRQGRPKRPKRT